MNRRGLLLGVGAFLAAPSIVRASSLMPVSVLGVAPRYWGDGIHDDAPNLTWQMPHLGVVRPADYYLFTPAKITGTKPRVIRADEITCIGMAPGECLFQINARNVDIYLGHLHPAPGPHPRDGGRYAVESHGP